MFDFVIKTPYEEAFSGKVKGVSLTTEGGDMEVFAEHASLTASVQFSHVVVDVDGVEDTFLVRNGIFMFDNEENEAALMVNYCEKKSEVSYQTVKEYAEFIEKQMEEGHNLSDFQIKFLEGEKLAVEEMMAGEGK